MGIEFEPKELKNGEVVDTYDRRRRQQRKDKTQKDEFDPEIAGMRKKAKKNIKPGYKKKIERRKQEKRRQARRRENRNKK
jgi:ATP-dependent RNA helicase CshB